MEANYHRKNASVEIVTEINTSSHIRNKSILPLINTQKFEQRSSVKKKSLPLKFPIPSNAFKNCPEARKESLKVSSLSPKKTEKAIEINQARSNDLLEDQMDSLTGSLEPLNEKNLKTRQNKEKFKPARHIYPDQFKAKKKIPQLQNFISAYGSELTKILNSRIERSKEFTISDLGYGKDANDVKPKEVYSWEEVPQKEWDLSQFEACPKEY